MPAASSANPELRFCVSLLIPARDEAGNPGPLLCEIDRAFADSPHRPQVIFINDGSADATGRQIDRLAADHPHVLALHHPAPRGQSAALRTGLLAAEAPLIATLDADLQNDPADLPRMIDLLHLRAADLVQGDRSAHRRDHLGRRLASAGARWVRRALLADPIRDTGCSTRVLSRELARRLPLHQPGMHRLIPASRRPARRGDRRNPRRPPTPHPRPIEVRHLADPPRPPRPRPLPSTPSCRPPTPYPPSPPPARALGLLIPRP